MTSILKYIFTLILLTSIGFGQSTFPGDKLAAASIKYAKELTGRNSEVILSGNIPDQKFNRSGIKAMCRAEVADLRGICFVYIDFSDNESIVKTIAVPVNVKISKDVPVASTIIRDGTLLSSNNIVIQKADITNIPADELIEMNGYTGKYIMKTVQRGTIITASMLGGENVVKRGDKVIMIVKSGGVSIKTSGFAMDDAETGATVKVKRDGSIFWGRALPDGSIIISDNNTSN